MAKPTVKDAELLLQIERLKVSEPMEHAFFWFSRELANNEPMTFEQFISKYPRDSESYRNYQLISQFFETVGTIAKHGLINLDFLFDRYGVSIFWEKLRFETEHSREEDAKVGPVLGENFEWLAKQNELWLSRHLKAMKRKGK